MSNYRTRSNATKKANATRRARAIFRETYPDTAEAAELLSQGYTTHEVADDLWLDVPNVAAILANLNRPGQFSEMAENCNF